MRCCSSSPRSTGSTSTSSTAGPGTRDALPLVINHGWPGSIIEQLKLGRPAHRSDRARRHRGGRVPRRHPVDARLRVLREADDHRLGPGTHGPGIGSLMGRLGYDRYVAQGGEWGAFVVGPDGPTGAAPDCSPSTPTCPRRFPPKWNAAALAGEPTPEALSAEERRAYEQLIRTSGKCSTPSTWPRDPRRCTALRIRPSDSPPGSSTTTTRTAGARPRPSPAGAGTDLERFRRAHPRRDPRQHHPLLADQHRRIRLPPLLGVQGRILRREGCHDTRRGDCLPR